MSEWAPGHVVMLRDGQRLGLCPRCAKPMILEAGTMQRWCDQCFANAAALAKFESAAGVCVG